MLNQPHILPANYGQPITISLPDPGNGNEIEFGVPVNTIILVTSCSFTFTANAGGSSREIRLEGFDGSNFIGSVRALLGQAGGTAKSYSAVAGVGVFDLAFGSVSLPIMLPTLNYLRVGDIFRTRTGALNGADAYTSVVIRYMQWIQE